MMINGDTKLGRYEIRSKLGAGGMGEVYLAEDTELHRKVALKILPADVVTNNDRNLIFWFDFSRDDKQLALSRGAQTSDVILIRDFK
jgi:serine/threonine protein kinase